jgi:hypothetical protein
MTSLLRIGWPTFLMALLVFGFAPGAVLRVILLAFEPDDPRRRELLGELYKVPRIERPFWVAEKMELALIEGLGGRLRKVIKRYNIRERLAKELREAKHDILYGTHSFGEHMIGYSLMCAPVYIIIYLHRISVSGIVALGLRGTFGVIRAHFYQRHKKRCEQAGRPMTANWLDALIFRTLVPAIYMMTIYSFARDMIVLIGGNFAPGYWIGLFVSLVALWMPWNLILTKKWVERIRKRVLDAPDASPKLG